MSVTVLLGSFAVTAGSDYLLLSLFAGKVSVYKSLCVVVLIDVLLCHMIAGNILHVTNNMAVHGINTWHFS